MELKFYTDKHIAKEVTTQLKNRGIDVVRCEDVGMDTASDTELLEYATKEGRVMVSVDKDFPKLHTVWLSEGKHHAGIFRIQRHIQADIGTMVKALSDYHEMIEMGAGTLEDDIHDQMIYIG